MKPSITAFFQSFPSRLKRVTSGSRIIPEIDGLRFLAIVPVILQHFKERMVKNSPVLTNSSDHLADMILSNGHIGVYIFFFISGFILALPFGKQKLDGAKPVSLPTYYLRRLTRLEPPYLICLTLFFILLVTVRHEGFMELIPHYAASFFYLHRIIYGVWSPINPLLWTLEVEVQFYILAPFLTLLYFSIPSRWLRRGLLAGIIVLKIVLANTTQVLDGFSITLPSVVEFFLAGILFTDLFLVEWKNGFSRHQFFDMTAMGSMILLFSTWTWEKNLTWKFIFILALFFTVYSTFRSVYVNRFFRLSWVTALGGMCYTIYLLHLGMIEFFVASFRKYLIWSPSFILNYATGLVVFLPILLVVSSAFFLTVEKPCMNPQWPSELWQWLGGKREKAKV